VSGESCGFSVYADFVQEQLAAEETRKTSLEQRGLAVITSSGVLAALGFGALALAKRGEAVPLPGPSPVLLVAGAVALLVAAVLALSTNAPLRHRAINPSAMKRTLREHASDEETKALIRVASTRIGLLGPVRHGNDMKAAICLAAMAAEVLGVALLGITICLVIFGSR
jgi:hypothetical protein